MIRKIINMIRHWLHPVGQSTEKSRKEWGDRLTTSQKKQIARGVRKFFSENYELRFNVMKQVEEFRQKATDGNYSMSNFAREATGYSGEASGWQQLTDRELRKMAFEQMEQVGVAWGIDVEQYVRSALTPKWNPISDYLDGCPQWDGTDHIRALARRVPCAFSEWPDWFHRWFLAMVAQWQQRSRDYGNSVVPLLIGGQGTHKSTFCKLILPPVLREYYIDDIK
ncbi:MAG: hypothetical protein IJ155_11590, partial [Prevotella sp.]|nr:hypothetical protein [Prevotella sp.]